MTRGDKVLIEHVTAEGAWEPYAALTALQVNGGRESGRDAAGTEQASKAVTFRVRWNRLLPPVEFRPQRYRIVWRGQTFAITGYDDYMYQHRTVDLKGESYG
ncbi:MAG: head-tail adaptor protein [Adlercreutzia sp.]|nr:head-tail adaptor protein [Adlercreutzia sp.]